MIKYGKKDTASTIASYDLTSDQHTQLRQITGRIHERHRKQVQSIIETGKDLIAAKQMLPHGQFQKWLDSEFGWTDRTARNYMAVADQFGSKSETVSDLPMKTVYELASPSLPDSIRDSVVTRLESGERIEPTEISKIVKEAKQGETGPYKVAVVEIGPKDVHRIVNVPDGRTLEAVGRGGLALEESGNNTQSVAEAIGIGREAYSKIREIILIHDHEDLADHDRTLANQALAAMNETSSIGASWALIEPIAKKMWGTKSRGSRTLEQQEAHRLELFDHGIYMLETACEVSKEMEIPYLGKDRQDEYDNRIDECIAHLRVLKRRVRDTRH